MFLIVERFGDETTTKGFDVGPAREGGSVCEFWILRVEGSC